MDSDDDISEGEILSDDGELTNNPDDEYEDGMLLDDEEGETDTEESNQSDITDVGDEAADEVVLQNISRPEWKNNRKRQCVKETPPRVDATASKVPKKTANEDRDRLCTDTNVTKCPVKPSSNSAATEERATGTAVVSPSNEAAEKEQNYTCTVLDLPKHPGPLPQGWKAVMHDCGVPLYHHKDSGVCTFARPFVVQKGDIVRAKEPPLSSLPCFEYQLYRKAKQSFHKNSSQSAHADDQNASKSGACGSVESEVQKSVKQTAGSADTKSEHKGPTRFEVMKSMPKSITLEEMQNYIEKLFVVNERRTLSEHKMRSRFAKKKMMKEKYDKKLERGVALVVKNGDRLENIRLLEANHTNRNYITVLNEYCSKALKTIPVYNCSNVLTSSVTSTQDSSSFASNDNSQSNPNGNNSLTQTHCVVSILNVKYGEASAVGKRLAKNLAAKQALKVLCPEVLRSDLGDLESDDLITSSLSFKLRIIDIFKSIKIGDPKVIDELKVREANAFAPMHLLNQFLIRNLAPPELKLHTNFESVKDTRSGMNCHECELKLGNKYSAKASAKTQNHASQLAALKLLEELHPSLIYYSSLIRLYGIDPTEVQMQKERQIREDVANGSQESTTACDTILKLLREEMRKVASEREQKKQKEATDGLKITSDDPEFFYTKLWQFDND